MKTLCLSDREFDHALIRVRYLVLSAPDANWALEGLLDVMESARETEPVMYPVAGPVRDGKWWKAQRVTMLEREGTPNWLRGGEGP